MNDILMNIMTFINEHTLLLIGICVFLILVLVGYLIDNSVKSKRVRNDIKNKDQVPKNIKDEIIKEAEDKMIIKENENIASSDVQMETVDLQPNQSSEANDNSTVILDEPKQEVSDIKFDSNEVQLNDIQNVSTPLNLDLNTSNDNLVIEVPKTSESQQINVDPDIDVMTTKNEYTNDKKLSEILSSNNYIETTNSDNIFATNTNNIVINNEVNKDDVQIQNNDSNDELDRIMRKLSTMNEQVEDDNYTNIF